MRLAQIPKYAHWLGVSWQILSVFEALIVRRFSRMQCAKAW